MEPASSIKPYLQIKKQLYSTLVIATLSSLAAFYSHSAVLVDDDWSDGDRTNTNLPDDSAWFASSVAGTPTLTSSIGALTGNVRMFETNICSRLWITHFTPAEYIGRVYLLRHRGEVVYLDPASGRTLWFANLPEHRTPYYSSPVIANGQLYAAREDGTIFVARVEEKFELLGENPMGERIVASPVPVANRLFIRGDNHLFCVAGE